MIDTILFDLDGTLLPLDVQTFMTGYFRTLAPHLEGIYHPDKLAVDILRATEAVIENEDPSRLNVEKFRQALFDNRCQEEEVVWPIFERFYETSFDELRMLTKPNAIAREICRTAKTKGYRIVLATNPIFPEIATRARMRWAGLADVSFDLITTMENSHYGKPNPKYFLEVMESLGVMPSQCLMVGNDVQEDGAATYVGISTYLVTDCLIDRGLGSIEFLDSGTLEDFGRFLEQLPSPRPR